MNPITITCLCAIILLIAGFAMYVYLEGWVVRKPKPVRNVAKEIEERLRKEAEERRTDIRNIEAMMFVGQPVIFVPNEWSDPVVGFVERVETEKGIIMYVHDYVRNEKRMFLGLPFHYTGQRLVALLKLNPYERACIVYGRSYPDVFYKPKSGVANTPAKVKHALHSNGFYKAKQKWLASNT